MAEMDDQDEVIRFLRDPGTHGAPVEVIETHASLVFLAGDSAIKLKRAVRYSYLDYSTPARRRAACEAEQAINARFAPSLYRGVEPVVRTDAGLRLGGEGAPVDWVVRMRRFDQAMQFDHLAEAGALTPALMQALGDRLAEIHAASEARPHDGGAAGLARAIDITLENLRLEAAAFPNAAIDAWSAHVQPALAAQSALLDARRSAGLVRACHGDLHLRNICLLDGVPTPFDAIEFDPSLSAIDVLYDLAFLLMDLHARGLDGLGNAVFNRYFDRAGGEDGLAALPLFLSVRAAIRAQVAAAAAHRATTPAKGVQFRQEAVRYLALATALLADPAPPRLVAIGGMSGTGKSTLAYRLAPALGAVPGARVLRSDVLRKRAAGVGIETRLPACAYTDEARAAVYRALDAAARDCLEAGHSVVADAAFLNAAERAAIEAAGAAGFRGLWLEAPADVRLRRVAARVGDASDADAGVVRAQAAHPPPAPPGWCVVDAGGAPDEVARRAAFALGGG